jgi:hypothetical protein
LAHPAGPEIKSRYRTTVVVSTTITSVPPTAAEVPQMHLSHFLRAQTTFLSASLLLQRGSGRGSGRGTGTGRAMGTGRIRMHALSKHVSNHQAPIIMTATIRMTVPKWWPRMLMVLVVEMELVGLVVLLPLLAAM